ncbi:hypothetical protein [Pseudoduganella sp.]|uniref:hypothetical protein n=1 Tax=Pseudoduganella sp. TaxID=1880898 RepID=UPI0035B4F167
MKTHPYVIAIKFGLPSCLALYLLSQAQIRSAAHVWNRNLYMALLAFAFLATAWGTYTRFRALQRLKGTEHKRVAATLKFRGELAATVALMTFAIPYYQVGLDLDRKAVGPRTDVMLEVSRIIKAELTPIFCTSKPGKKENCDIVNESLEQIATALVAKDETAISTAVRAATFHLENTLDIVEDTSQGRNVQRAMLLLKSLDLSAEGMTLLLRALPLITLISALFAVSRKVAVAWDDHVRQMAEDKPRMYVNS